MPSCPVAAESTGDADDKAPAATTEGEGAGVTLSDIEKDTQEPDNTPYFMSDAGEPPRSAAARTYLTCLRINLPHHSCST